MKYMEKYKIIETDIINAIQDGEFKTGEKLPGEVELCENIMYHELQYVKQF